MKKFDAQFTRVASGRILRSAVLCMVIAALAPSASFADDLSQVDITNGCMAADCHADMLNRPKVHSAVAMEQCEGCHEAKGDVHVFKPMAAQPDLCYACHDEFPTDQKLHGALEMAECLDCHDPHGSKVPQLLVDDSLVDNCLGCHDDPRDDFPSSHGPAAKGACTDCHQPHYSRFDHMLNTQDADLCFTCHNKTIARKGQAPVQNIQQIMKSANYLHAPFNMGECLACHGPHGGVSAPSLSHAFPSGLYANFSVKTYDLCFQCHDSAMVTERETDKTAFRKGTLNLHYLHVNQAKGRSCSLCHDAHGTDLPHMLRETVQFGRWSFPLRFEEVPTGASCWPGCHRQQTYDRGRTALVPASTK